jgi:hypothetical protein
MVPAVKCIGAISLVMLLLSAASAHASTGPYLDFASWPSFAPGQSTSGPTFIGPEGVPQVRYWWGVEDNPVTVSHWALQHWSWWLQRGEQADLDAVTGAAEWLVFKQDDGRWEYAFATDAGGVPMTAPWISAMAQGEAISVLVRAASATGDQRYLDAAAAGLAPFDKTAADGGVRAEWDGLTWFEEYPGEKPAHVLNGFQVALVGLHDLAETGNVDAQRLWEEGAASLIARIGRFDAPAARSQLYAALGPGHGVVVQPYPRFHAVLTRELASITGDPVLEHWATVWEGYLRPLPRPSRPPVPSPAPAAMPMPAPRVPTVAAPAPRKAACRLNGATVHIAGRVSCRNARTALKHYVRHHRSPRRWRCHGIRWVVCRRAAVRVSVRAPARRSSRASAGGGKRVATQHPDTARNEVTPPRA